MFSFRLQTFLVALALAIVMLGFSFIITRAQLIDYEQTRFENRLCMELRRLTKNKLEQDNIERVWKDMSQKLHLTKREDLVFSSELILADDLIKTYRTPNWSENFNGLKATTNEARLITPSSKACHITTREGGNEQWVESRTSGEFGQAVLLVKKSAAFDEVHLVMTKTMIWLSAIFVAFAAMGALFISRFVSRPVLRLQASMQKINKKDLHSRLSTENEFSEFQAVIRSYNAMLDRLELSFQNASRFAANAAHELRTPLTILTVKLERAINRPSDQQTKLELSTLLEEVSRLNSITQKLLFLAQAEAGTFPLQFDDVKLSTIAQELVADLEMLDESALISTRIEAGITVHGDPVLLRQLLSNLLTNAIRYCERDKAISIDIITHETKCLITISNHSKTIEEEERTRFFDAFFRGQSAYQKHTDGTGLGLNVAAEIARLHEGQVSLLKTPLDIVSIQVSLPLKSKPD